MSPCRTIWFVLTLASSLIEIGQAQSASDSWTILANGRGVIGSRTTKKDLVERYGATNVVDEDVALGEGETQPGTVVFPKDPERRIEILWKDRDKMTAPASVQVSGTKSQWKTAHDISLGTSLKELERLNGRPFKLAGFDWDYSGTVTSWEQGILAANLGAGHGRVILRLGPSISGNRDKDIDQVVGDGDFPSNHPIMQKLNPRAYEMIVEFP